MLETDEGDSLSVDYELTGIGGTHTHHEHDINIRIDAQERSALLFRISGERDHVNSLEHRAEVYPTRKCGRANDFQKMWSCWIQDVVMPVSL
jgi:hypothetical protein